MKFSLLLSFILILNFLVVYGYNIKVHLYAPSSSVLHSTPVTVYVNFTNHNNETIYLLKRGSPFETNAGFKIILNTHTVQYEGIIANSVPESDYLEIRAGEMKSLQSELSKNFNFTNIGTYHISFDYFIQVFIFSAEGKKVELNPDYGLSNEIMLNIIENPNIQANPSHPSIFHTRASYPCNPLQLNITNIAWTAAKSSVSKAFSGFNGSSSAYATWFGSRSNNREMRVHLVLDKLKSMSTFSFNCNGDECANNKNAYINPTDTTAKNIYLCGAFWTNPNNQIRVLINLATAFNDIGGTQYYATEILECQKLAKETPDKAIFNANSYNYFVTIKSFL